MLHSRRYVYRDNRASNFMVCAYFFFSSTFKLAFRFRIHLTLSADNVRNLKNNSFIIVGKHPIDTGSVASFTEEAQNYN